MEIPRQQEIFGIILENQPIGISDIAKKLTNSISIPTLNRDLTSLKNDKLYTTF